MKEYIFQIDDAIYNEETGETVFKPKFAGELVRCKDCIYFGSPLYIKNFHACVAYKNRHVREDDYCSFGERKNEIS